MIDSRAFDGLVMFLLVAGMLFGASIAVIAFWLIPWLCHHLSIHWM